jgi:hypothetical protein
MRFSEVPVGVRVALVEPMNDGGNSHEVRCTYYEARPGDARFSPKYRCAYRVRTVQGDPMDERPRFDTQEHRTETEVPMALPVVMADETPMDAATLPDDPPPDHDAALRAGEAK